jgi:hypothetical protein
VADTVVTGPPASEDNTNLSERHEQRLAQKLCPLAATKAFDESILHGLARCNVVPFNAVTIDPY